MIDVLVLDVNETLSDLEPLRDRFVAAGLPAHSLDAWFAATLRDGFALTAAGAYADFRAVAADVLASPARRRGRSSPPRRRSTASCPASPGCRCILTSSRVSAGCTRPAYGSSP